ncbi:DUF7546 family protein [Haloglomus litoreum]|uniref:DUF7546 family protein n=1 Tax=Haloglomus litoreum TaxID=3034026 RepID=UPI0023E7B5E0|nr:hypothetical protein [Haloglomus sp. DT116]
MSTIESRLASLRPSRETAVWWAVVLNTELLVLLAYLVVETPIITRPLFYLVPFVWINVALWGVFRVSPRATSTRQRLAALAIAGGYFLVLGYFGGLYGPSAGPATGLRVAFDSIPPGWGPAVIYGGTVVQFALLPFKLVGYATLAYLVYATVIDAASSVVGGVLGLFSCVSCTLPVIAGVVSGFVGSTSAVAAAAYNQSYLLSTVVFVVTVILLVWRPTMSDVRGLREAF